MDKDPADIVKQTRRAVGRSQRDFAALIGTAESTVQRWESGALVPRGPVQSLCVLILSDPRRTAEVLESFHNL